MCSWGVFGEQYIHCGEFRGQSIHWEVLRGLCVHVVCLEDRVLIVGVRGLCIHWGFKGACIVHLLIDCGVKRNTRGLLVLELALLSIPNQVPTPLKDL